MRNHVHLLITVDHSMSIEKALQLIKGNFSYRARNELGFKGEVWNPVSPMSASVTKRAFEITSRTSTTIR